MTMDKSFNIEASSVVHAITKVATYVNEAYKGVAFKKEAELKLIYGDYLKHVHKNNTHIKSLMHRNPMLLKKLYEPMDLIYRDANREEHRVMYGQIIPEIISKSKLIIQGVGGLGKSLLLKSLFLELLNQEDFIPILIDLKKYQGGKLIDFVFQTMRGMSFRNLTKEQFEYTLTAGHYVLLLDSFDEIDSQYVLEATQEIIGFSELYGANKYLVASRPFDTERFTAWQNFFEYDLDLLTKEQMTNMIARVNTEGEENSAAFIEALEEKFEGKREYLGNPLLLTVLLLTYNKYGELPTDYLDFYERAYTVLFREHDFSKNAYKRNRLAPLTESQFKRILTYIAALMVVKSQILIPRSDLLKRIEEAKEEFGVSDFPPEDFIEDAVQALCLLVKEGTDYKFIHKNFQEFFAGKYFAAQTDEFLEKNVVRYILDYRINLQQDRTLLATIYQEARERHDKNIILPLVNDFYRDNFNEFLSEFGIQAHGKSWRTFLLVQLCFYIYDLYEINKIKGIGRLIVDTLFSARVFFRMWLQLTACRELLNHSPKPSDNRFA